MKNQTNATELSTEEKHTIGRRELLKALAAGGGAVAASTMLSGKWVKPVIEAGVLPAHAASSAVYVYYAPPFVNTAEVEGLGENGPSAILVTVNGATGMANVQVLNGHADMIFEANLNINGSASDVLTPIDGCAKHDPFAEWNVVGYTLGDPTITIHSDGESDWTVTAPKGTGPLNLDCEE